MVLQWANKMVTRWACAVIGDRCVVVTVIFNNCKIVVVEDDVIGIVFEGRQRRLNYLWIPNNDGFVYVNQGGGFLRSGKNSWCWLRERCSFVKYEGAEGLDCFHFVGRCVLDACNGSSQSVCGVNDSVGGHYLWDWDGMMLEPERVGDPLAASVSHVNSNALIVIHGMQ
jgi:hypothetical protein